MTRNDMVELAGGVLFFAMLFAMLWLLAWLTPDQLSAEADWNKAEHDKAGVEYLPHMGGER